VGDAHARPRLNVCPGFGAAITRSYCDCKLRAAHSASTACDSAGTLVTSISRSATRWQSLPLACAAPGQSTPRRSLTVTVAKLVTKFRRY